MTLYMHSLEWLAIHFKEYGYLLVLLISLLTVAIVKIMHPFWNLQPVYHTYDLWRWGYWSPFVFYKKGTPKTKYYDPIHVKTSAYSELAQEEIAEWVDFLQIHFLATDRIFCVLRKEHIEAHMVGGGQPSYLSFYREIPLPSLESPSLGIKGCIVSRPVKLFFQEGGLAPLHVYYWDFLCSLRERKESTAILRKLIQTNEYNQRLLNPDIQISVFKKEVSLCEGVVPFTQFKTRTYYLQMGNPPKLPLGYECVRIFKENGHLLEEALQNATQLFSVSLLPEFGNILALIHAKIFFVYLLKHKDVVCGVYIFKDLFLHYEDLDTLSPEKPVNVDDLGNSIHCIASIQKTETPLFYLGFLYSLSLILRYNPKYRILLMEEVADNPVLLRAWNRPPIFETDTAYYFYNYFYPYTVASEKCLLLF